MTKRREEDEDNQILLSIVFHHPCEKERMNEREV